MFTWTQGSRSNIFSVLCTSCHFRSRIWYQPKNKWKWLGDDMILRIAFDDCMKLHYIITTKSTCLFTFLFIRFTLAHYICNISTVVYEPQFISVIFTRCNLRKIKHCKCSSQQFTCSMIWPVHKLNILTNSIPVDGVVVGFVVPLIHKTQIITCIN